MRTIRSAVMIFAVLTVAFFGWRWVDSARVAPATPAIKILWALSISAAVAAAVWAVRPRRRLVMGVIGAMLCLVAFDLCVEGVAGFRSVIEQPAQTWRLVPFFGLLVAAALAAARKPQAVA